MDYRGPSSLRYRAHPRARSLSPRRRASRGGPPSMSGMSATPPSGRYAREVDDRYYRRDHYYRDERLPSPPLLPQPLATSFSPPPTRGSYRDERDYYYSAHAQRPPPPPPPPHAERYNDRYYSRDRHDDRRYRPSPYYSQPQPSRPPRSRRPIDRGSEQDRRDSSTIFIGNLPYEFRERDIYDMFERYGPLVKVTVPMDAVTGKNKGFAFAEFEKRRDAEDAFDKMHGFSVEGRRLKLDWDIGLSKKDEHRNVSRRPDDWRSPSGSYGRPLSPPPPPPPPMPRYSRASMDMYRR